MRADGNQPVPAGSRCYLALLVALLVRIVAVVAGRRVRADGSRWFPLLLLAALVVTRAVASGAGSTRSCGAKGARGWFPPSQVMSFRDVMPCHVVSRRVMSHHVISVMSCHVMSCHVMSCRVMSRPVPSRCGVSRREGRPQHIDAATSLSHYPHSRRSHSHSSYSCHSRSRSLQSRHSR